MRDGEAVTKIEVRVVGSDGDGTSLERVSVIQNTHTPLAVQSGMVPASTCLVFEQPAAYLAQLEALEATLKADADTAYVPTSECVVGRSFETLVLRLPPTAGTTSARGVWQRTRGFLKGVSTATKRCANQHALNEATRTKCFEVSSRVCNY